MATTLKLKRVYDEPKGSDGARVLVDRLWPRGISKAAAKIDAWEKELAPSRELIAWFHEDKAKRFTEFKRKYRRELAGQKTALKELPRRRAITLVTAVKDAEHSHIPTLMAFLKKHL